MQLFYNATITTDTDTISFDREESKHIAKVLRKQSGDCINITNGLGELFECELSLVTPNKCIAELISVKSYPKRKYNIHLAVAPTKMNERYEWFLEKATEIGIDEITPIICKHSERKIIKEQRFDKVLVSAMKQSLQFHKPKLNSAIPFSEFVRQNQPGQKFIAHCEETNKNSFKNAIGKQKDIIVLIGPEGDFNPKEIVLAIENEYKPVTLGETRLRTETAALVACHSIIYTNE